MNRLLQMMLERRGIYMAPAGADGADGGGAGGDGAGDDAGQESGGDGAGAGDNGGDNGGDGAGDGDGDDKGDSGKGDGSGDDKGKDGDQGDKPKVDDEKAQLIKDVMKWKGEAKETKNELAEIRKLLGDLDPAKARELADQAKERERTELEKKGQYEQVLQQVRDEHKKTVDGLKEQLGQKDQALNDALKQVENLTVGTNFRSSEFISKQSTLPPTIAQKEFGAYFEYEDGQLVPYTKPRGEKDRAPMVDGDGKPKSFDAAIQTLFEQHPDAKSLIRTTVKAGAGSKSQQDLANKGKKAPEVRGLGKIELGLKEAGNSQ